MRASMLAAALAVAGFAGVAAARPSITTLFMSNNGGSAGGGVYYNLTTGSLPIDITGFETNTSFAAGGPVAFRVWIVPGTFVGNHANPGFWGTEVATGTGTSAGTDNPTAITLSNIISLSANTQYAVAISLSDGAGMTAAHRYSGTGSNPAPGQLQYSNADLTLDLGSATNVLFAGSAFTPRIWNGTIHYTVIPTPASLALLGLGGLVAARRRR